MSVKKIFLIVLLGAIIIASGVVIFNVPQNKIEVNQKSNNRLNRGTVAQKLDVVVTNFASYDFIRAIAGDKVTLEFLMGPGKDAHSYEPTAQELITIQQSDIFIYVGGEMEKWSDKVLSAVDTSKTKVFCIADYVDTIDEKEVDGAEEHEEEHDDEEHESGENHEDYVHAFDEHIWTSPNNAIKMVNALKDILTENDIKNSAEYAQNAKKYEDEIKAMQSEIKAVVDNKVRDRLVFGDKMPMQYFLDEFGLTASAAFTGCSTETEPSASTIAYLVNKVKEEKIPVVLYIELNTGKVANMIANEVGEGVVTMQIQTLHNVTKTDFDNGETYVSLMRKNIDVLKKALQ